MTTYGVKYASFQADQEQRYSDNDRIVTQPNAGDPSSGPIRCKAYLKKIAAVIIGIVAGIVLGIPVAAICLPGLPCLLSHHVRQRKDVSDIVKDIASGCERLFLLPALPMIGLFHFKVIDATAFLIKDYPKELWREANVDLDRANRIDQRALYQSTREKEFANENNFTSSKSNVDQYEPNDEHP